MIIFNITEQIKSFLSDEYVDQLWNQRNRSSSNGFIGAVYHMDTPHGFSTTRQAIPFNVEKINNGMEYKSGVFLIEKPGYYRIVTHLKSKSNSLQYNIVKNSRENLIYTNMNERRVSSTHYIAHLELYDMISIELAIAGSVGDDPDCNLVQIEKID